MSLYLEYTNHYHLRQGVWQQHVCAFVFVTVQY
jgi:hypothetical protein